MMQQDINPYNPEEFKKYFETTSLYKLISNDYEIVSYFFDPFFDITWTCRSILTRSIFDASLFYYLKYLTDLNPSKIFDVGCGNNISKKYIDNIIGIDVPNSKNYFKDSNPDITIDIDDYFYEKNFEKMEAAFAVNSLHFLPISKIRDRVIQFSSLISKHGRGFITFNVKRMLESELNVDTSVNFEVYSTEKIEKFIRKELYNLPFKIEVFECLINKQLDEGLNGNVRIVFTK